MILVMNVDDTDTSHKEDDAVGGDNVVYARGATLKEKNNKIKKLDINWTFCLGRSAVVCVVIYAGKERNLFVETAVDTFAKQIKKLGDVDYFEKNLVKVNSILDVLYTTSRERMVFV